MKNDKFDYSYHYQNWHSDTPESEKVDIKYIEGIFNIHNLWPENKKAKILEIGCGMGRMFKMLRNYGYADFTGCDIDASQIKVAKRNEKNVFLADAYDFLANDNNKYDAIYMFDILEHIDKEQQLSLLKQIEQHLTPNGFVAIRVPCAMAPVSLFFVSDDFTHCTTYTKHSIGFLLHNAKLHNFTVRPEYQESEYIQRLKLPWARLYRDEFDIKDIIMTPNLFAIAFKNEKNLNKYMSSAPEIHNDYNEPQPAPKKSRGLKRLWKHLCHFKF